MMKRLLLLALVLCLALLAVSCGEEVRVIDNAVSSSEGQPAVPSAPEGSVNGFLFKAGETTVAMDAKMAPVLEALGQPKQYYEAASCAFNGLDKMYTYEHFQIDTYPAADGDRVMAVYLMDDLVATPEGLRLGDPKSRMEELYGASYETVGAECVYEKGGTKLRVLFENDAVSYITFASSVLGTVAN